MVSEDVGPHGRTVWSVALSVAVTVDTGANQRATVEAAAGLESLSVCGARMELGPCTC